MRTCVYLCKYACAFTLLTFDCFPKPIHTYVQSADTGGLLENDWTTPKRHRLKVLQTVQPSPSRLFFDGEKFVYKPGAYANRECDPRWRIWEEQERQRLREGGYDVEWKDGGLRPVAQSMRHPHTFEEEDVEAAMVREWAAYEEN